MHRDPILEQLEQSKKDALAENEAAYNEWLKNDFTFMLLDDFETERKAFERDIVTGFLGKAPIEELHRIAGKLDYVKKFELSRLRSRKALEIQKSFKEKYLSRAAADSWKI